MDCFRHSLLKFSTFFAPAILQQPLLSWFDFDFVFRIFQSKTDEFVAGTVGFPRQIIIEIDDALIYTNCKHHRFC